MIVRLFFSFVLLYYLPCLPTTKVPYCTFLRRGTLEGCCCCGYLIPLLQFIPRAANALSIYLVNCTNDTFLTSANFLDLVLVLLLAFLFLCLSLSLSLSYDVSFDETHVSS